MKLTKTKAIMLGCLLVLPISKAFAVPVVYSGYDAGSGSLAASPNATAAAASFDAAVTGSSIIDFESTIPSDVTITGGTTTNNAGCSAALCGYNTTVGGSYFSRVYGGTSTFDFSTPIDSFGAYFTGWQISTQTLLLTYSDASTVLLNMPTASSTGGTVFFGFTDVGASITSVAYNAVNDIVMVDDVRYRTSGDIPEPATLALMGLGLAGIGFSRKKKVS
ncbi:MAG: PEP-CTERM sorting domain-containing protein [Sedimenticola sp.]